MRLLALIGSGVTWAVIGGLLYEGLPALADKPPEIVGLSLGQFLVTTAGAVALGWLLVVVGLLRR